MSAAIRKVRYRQDAIEFDGALATAGTGQRPGVLVIHGWEGRSEGQDAFAGRLASLGYHAFCVDLYGNGRRGSTPAECEALMTPWLSDRAALRRRLLHAVEAAAGQPEIDPARVGVVGFCFGGLCALDLARANAPVRAIASFHGTLGAPDLEPAERIEPKIIVFHGWDDPMAPPGDVVALAAELTSAGADWQLHAYGGTMHAFMAEGIDAPERGLQYNARSASRAWRSLESYLGETLS